MTNNHSGAYTAVNARKTLGAKMTAAPVAPAPPPKSKTEFPPKMKAYVSRTFEDIHGEDHADIEAELKAIITDAFDRGVQWEMDWDNMELPHIRIQRRRNGGVVDTDIAMKDLELETKRIEQTSFRIKTELDSPTSGSKKRKNSHPISPMQVDRTTPPKFDPRNPYAYNGDKSAEMDMMRDKRAKRFARELGVKTNAAPPWQTKESQYNTAKVDMDTQQPIVGRSMELEKRYLRLTSAPDPNMVRPLHILEKTLEFLKKKWRTENNYSYICDQFKSLRQDLTVQHIKNEFTINVYEIHGRIALEKGDLGEYNQCQSQLQKLYREIPGAGHPCEFKAYRILYLLYTCNQTDMGDILASLTKTEKADKAITHALAVRSTLALRNYHRFFRLYLDCPNMGAYLMDSFIERERLAAMENICKAYRVYVDLRFLTEELGFESDNECAQFLTTHGAGDLLEEKKDSNGRPVGVRFNCPPARAIFSQAKETAFRKVDIKGQI